MRLKMQTKNGSIFMYPKNAAKRTQANKKESIFYAPKMSKKKKKKKVTSFVCFLCF